MWFWPAALVALTVAVAISPIQNAWNYGIANAVPGSSAWFAGASHVGMDLLRIAMPVIVLMIWRATRWFTALVLTLVGIVVWVALVAHMLVVAVGKDAIVQSTRVGEQALAERTASDLRASLARVERRLGEISERRSVQVIDDLLTAERATYRWRGSKQCAEPAGSEFERFCKAYHKLRADRAAAVEGDGLREQVAELTAKIATAQNAVPKSDSLAEIAAVAYAIGVDLKLAAVGWSVGKGVLFSLVPEVTLFLAGVLWPARSGRWRQPELRWRPEQEIGGAGDESGAVGNLASARAAEVEARSGPASALAPTPCPNPLASRVFGLVSPAPPSAPTIDVPPSAHTPANCGAEEAAAAVEAFVCHLDLAPQLRSTGGELKAAYDRARRLRGWPELSPAMFGQLLKPAVEHVGGRKTKIRGQQLYIGVGVPTQHLHLVANANTNEGT